MRAILSLCGLLLFGFLWAYALPALAGWQRDLICQGGCGGGCPCTGESAVRDRPSKEEIEYSAHVKAYNNANRHWRKNEYADAEVGFRRALALEPGDPQTLHGLGAVIAAQGRFAEAEPYLRRALSAEQKSSWYNSLIFVLHNQDRLKEADEAASEAIRLDTSNEYAHRSLKGVRADRIYNTRYLANRLQNERYSWTLGQLQAIADNYNAPGVPTRGLLQKVYASQCFDKSPGCTGPARLLTGSPTVSDVIEALQTNPSVPQRIKLKKPMIPAWESVRDVARGRLEAVRAREAEVKGAAAPEPAQLDRIEAEKRRYRATVAGANAAIVDEASTEYTWDTPDDQ